MSNPKLWAPLNPDVFNVKPNTGPVLVTKTNNCIVLSVPEIIPTPEGWYQHEGRTCVVAVKATADEEGRPLR